MGNLILRCGDDRLAFETEIFEDEIIKDILKTIPSRPEIPLRNYLLELVGKSDGKESSLYLNGIEKFIREMWNDIVQSNWRKLDVREFVPEKLGVHYTTMYGYKNAKKAIPIQILHRLALLWKEQCNKSEQELNEKWNEIYKSFFCFSTHSKHQKVSLPKFLSPKLSYVLGWICGDGHLRVDGNHYLIKISEKSTKQLKFVLKPLLKELFDVDVPIFKRYKAGYALQVGSKPIFRFLTQVLKIKVGQIPPLVNNLDKINRKYFLLGLFDSEGHVGSSCLDPRVTISQSDKEFLNQVIKFFKELGVYFTGPYFHKSQFGTWYSIRVRKKSEILNFASSMGSCHVDKLQKLRNLAGEINANRNC